MTENFFNRTNPKAELAWELVRMSESENVKVRELNWCCGWFTIFNAFCLQNAATSVWSFELFGCNRVYALTMRRTVQTIRGNMMTVVVLLSQQKATTNDTVNGSTIFCWGTYTSGNCSFHCPWTTSSTESISMAGVCQHVTADATTDNVLYDVSGSLQIRGVSGGGFVVAALRYHTHYSLDAVNSKSRVYAARIT